jgi:hypothetical protein
MPEVERIDYCNMVSLLTLTISDMSFNSLSRPAFLISTLVIVATAGLWWANKGSHPENSLPSEASASPEIESLANTTVPDPEPPASVSANAGAAGHAPSSTTPAHDSNPPDENLKINESKGSQPAVDDAPFFAATFNAGNSGEPEYLWASAPSGGGGGGGGSGKSHGGGGGSFSHQPAPGIPAPHGDVETPSFNYETHGHGSEDGDGNDGITMFQGWGSPNQDNGNNDGAPNEDCVASTAATLPVTPVPEPSTYGLLGTSVLALVLLRRRFEHAKRTCGR